MAKISQQPLRILCLHGYRQNAQFFKEKSGGARKNMSKNIEFDFLDAPFEVFHPPEIALKTESQADNNRGQQRAWWFSKVLNNEGLNITPEHTSSNPLIPQFSLHYNSNDQYFAFKACEYSNAEFGFAEAVETCKKKFEQSGPYDGIFAFSQGAALAVLLVILMERRLLDWCNHIKFVILVSPFQSRCAPHRYLYHNCYSNLSNGLQNISPPLFISDNNSEVGHDAVNTSNNEARDISKGHDSIMLKTPALIIFGETDLAVTKEMTEEVGSMFSDVTYLPHAGGHYIPSGSSVKSILHQFISRFSYRTISTM